MITVGELSKYSHGKRRLERYGSNGNSWFNKTKAGTKNGFFDVKETNLLDSTNISTDELRSELYGLQKLATYI